jgi:hypothetical protein
MLVSRSNGLLEVHVVELAEDVFGSQRMVNDSRKDLNGIQLQRGSTAVLRRPALRARTTAKCRPSACPFAHTLPRRTLIEPILVTGF